MTEQHNKALADTISERWIDSAKNPVLNKEHLIIDTLGTKLSPIRALTGSLVLASHIKKISPEQNVATLLPTSAGTMLCNMAILLLGKTLVNLNYTANAESIKSSIAQAGIQTIYTSSTFLQRLEARGIDTSWLEIRKRLLSKRNKNSSPKDEKILASWNGYALSALAKLYAIKPQPAVRNAGNRLFDLLLRKAKHGPVRTAAGVHRRYLDDYAFVAQGLLDWSEVTKKSSVEQTVKTLLQQAQDSFLSRDGWRLSDDQVIPLPSDKLVIADGDLPSPAVVLLTLMQRTGMKLPRKNERADRHFISDPIGHASTVEYYVRHE